MTEEEATTNRCPQSMSGAITRTCVASRCMAWRWVLVPDPAWANAPGNMMPSKTEGYCGLAGVPQ